jgi:O-antigen ligase
MLPALNSLRPALLLSALVVILFLLNLQILRDRNPLRDRQLRLYTLLLLVMIGGVPFAVYWKTSFLRIFTSYINVALFVYIAYCAVDSMKRLYVFMAVICIGTGMYFAASIFSWDFATDRLNFADTFDPNDLSFVAVSVLPLNFLFLSKDNPLLVRVIFTGFICTCAMVLVASGSRGGLVAAAVQVALILISPARAVKPAVKVLIVATGVLLFTFMPINFERYKTFSNIDEDYNVWSESGRFSIWKIGLEVFLADPLTGVGVGCFPEAVGTYRAGLGRQQLWQSPHNTLVEIGTECGVFGLILFVMLCVRAFRIYGRAREKVESVQLYRIGEFLRMGFVGSFVAGMFIGQGYSFYWAFYVTVSAVLVRLGGLEPSGRRAHGSD